jgi:lipopolysaccharide transport system ATP-binding protein
LPTSSESALTPALTPRPAISIRHIGKRYHIGGQYRSNTLRDLIANPRLMLQARAREREFWALDDVSFDIPEGSVFGIVGRNGAGKSTLLKILTRITEPTRGEARMYGRAASLLEVGTGFHPELTGRENIYLNGSILGMSRAEIRHRFDDIVTFAEIHEHLDTPVKRYSSGMYVRLAFAVAAHLEPDILLVDEVLAVGDAAFQRKCIGKLEEIGSHGRTVVVVSHNMDTVSRLCQRVAWIAAGKLRAIGPSAAVIGRYLSDDSTRAMTWIPSQSRNDAFVYHSVSIERNSSLETGDVIAADEGFTISFDFTVLQPLPPGRIAFRIDNEEGRVAVTSASTDASPSLNASWHIGRTVLRCAVPGHLLVPGRYFVTISEPQEHGNILHDGILGFAISEQGSLVSRDGRAGIVAPLLRWQEETS